jgi:hypothetical protein
MMLPKVDHEMPEGILETIKTEDARKRTKRRRKEVKIRIDNLDNGLILSDYAQVGRILQSSHQKIADSAINAALVTT